MCVRSVSVALPLCLSDCRARSLTPALHVCAHVPGHQLEQGRALFPGSFQMPCLGFIIYGSDTSLLCLLRPQHLSGLVNLLHILRLQCLLCQPRLSGLPVPQGLLTPSHGYITLCSKFTMPTTHTTPTEPTVPTTPIRRTSAPRPTTYKTYQVPKASLNPIPTIPTMSISCKVFEAPC